MRIYSGASRWQVYLKSGAIVGIWASSYREEDGNYVFALGVESNAVEIKEEHAIPVTQYGSEQSMGAIAVASIPASEVEEILTEDWVKVPEVYVPA